MLPAPDGETIYVVEEKGRLRLDYYKNNTLHFFHPLQRDRFGRASSRQRRDPGGRSRGDRRQTLGPSADRRCLSQTTPTSRDRSRSASSDSPKDACSGSRPTRATRRDAGRSPCPLARLRSISRAWSPCFWRPSCWSPNRRSSSPRGPMTEAELAKSALRLGQRFVLEGRVLRAEAAAKAPIEKRDPVDGPAGTDRARRSQPSRSTRGAAELQSFREELQAFPGSAALAQARARCPARALVRGRFAAFACWIRTRQDPLHAEVSPCSWASRASVGEDVSFEKLLVPVDFSEGSMRALRTACELLEVVGRGKLDVMHAWYTPAYVSPEIAVRLADGMTQDTRTTRPAGGGATAERVPRRIRFPERSRTRDPVRVWASRGHDQPNRTGVRPPVVMGTHGRSGITKLFTGSVAEKVVRTSTVPVLVVR